jgi:hypothetical protein
MHTIDQIVEIMFYIGPTTWTFYEWNPQMILKMPTIVSFPILQADRELDNHKQHQTNNGQPLWLFSPVHTKTAPLKPPMYHFTYYKQ